MMKFLFTSNPLLGHFLPMVPLIRAVQGAGHQVRVATGADLAPAVHRHGFPIWAVGPTLSQIWAETASTADPTQDEEEQQRRAAAALFGYPAVVRARQLVPMAASWRPDVVVHELYELAGWEAAAAAGAPDVLHGFGVLEGSLPELAEHVGSVVAEQLGTPNRASDLFAAPYLDPCPPSLQSPELNQFGNALSIRPEVGASYPGERLPDPLRRLPYRRTIYLTLGTAFNTPESWRLALEAVRELNVNVIATTGGDLDPADLGPQPAHVAMARFVPQALVLRGVDAVVCHCGSGTMLGALAEGRPVVALPMAADQFANAEQVVRAGAGLAVPADGRTPEAIRSAIEQVLETPSFAQAAHALQAEIAAMPSAEQRLAELVERAGALPASVR